jgi:hypothetical protein
VARAVETGSVAAILPSIAAVDLKRMRARKVNLRVLDTLKREICLAWNPRLLRIKRTMEEAKKALGRTLRF